MLNFSVEIESGKEVPIVRVKGEIDIYTCPKLNETLTQILEDGNTRIILNLEDIQYIDSTGLGTVAHCARQLDIKSGHLNVVCTKPQIVKIFEVSGLDKKNITLFSEEASALGALV